MQAACRPVNIVICHGAFLFAAQRVYCRRIRQMGHCLPCPAAPVLPQLTVRDFTDRVSRGLADGSPSGYCARRVCGVALKNCGARYGVNRARGLQKKTAEARARCGLALSEKEHRRPTGSGDVADGELCDEPAGTPDAGG